MTNEFDNEENFVVEDNPAIETGEFDSGNYAKRPKGLVAVIAIIVVLVGLIYAFTCTNLKYITSPNKMAFINYLEEDITTVTNFNENNDFLKFITRKTPKVLEARVKEKNNNISVTAIINKDSFATKLNNSNDKLYLIDFTNLDKLYENLEIDDEVPVNANTFTEKELDVFRKFGYKCYNIFKNTLDNDDFIVIKDNKILVNGTEIEADSAEVKITETKMMEIAKIFLEELRKSELVDVIFENVEDMDMTKEEFLQSIDEILADYDEVLEELKEEIAEGYHAEQYFIYRMYNKNGIISRELVIGSDEDVDYSMALVTDNNYYEFKVILESFWPGKTTTTISDTITDEKDVKYHNIKAISQYTKREYVHIEPSDSSNPFARIGSYEYKYIPVTEEKTFKIKAENDDTKFTLIGFDGVDVIVDIDGKVKVDVSANDIDVNIDIIEDKNMTTEKLIENGAVILNDMTVEELESEMMTLVTYLE